MRPLLSSTCVKAASAFSTTVGVQSPNPAASGIGTVDPCGSVAWSEKSTRVHRRSVLGSRVLRPTSSVSRILLARKGASRVNRAPVELDCREHVEGLRIGRCGAVHMHLPVTGGVLEIDRLDAVPGTMEEQALLAKCTLEVVTEFCGTARGGPPSKRIRYHSGMPDGDW